MKLYFAFIGTLRAYSSPFGEPHGCNPAELQGYEITDDCKSNKGYHNRYDRDPNGLLLEKRGNYCRWQCKYDPQLVTTYVQCRCQRNNANGTFDCSYQIKLVRKNFRTQWLSFDHKEDGTYPLDKWGYGGRHFSCAPRTTGEYGEWSPWFDSEGRSWRTCDGECGFGWELRSRECSADYCEGLAQEARRCVAFDNYNHHGGCSRMEGKKVVEPQLVEPKYQDELGLNFRYRYL